LVKIGFHAFPLYTSKTGGEIMRKLFQLTLMSFMIIATSACLKQKESIDPIAPVTTMAELQHEALMNVVNTAGQSELSVDAQATLDTAASDPSIFYLNIKYSLKDIDVFEAAKMPNTFEQIGDSFLRTLAKLYLKITGGTNVAINDIDLNIPDISIDRTIIKSFKIKKIFLTYNHDLDVGSDYLANFSFINTLELSRKVTVPKVGQVETLFLSYRKNRNFCLYKCLQFDILEDNIIDILKPNTNIKLSPSLSIGTLPAINDLKIDGEIQMQIGLKLPF
jgi:hypothetical protein